MKCTVALLAPDVPPEYICSFVQVLIIAGIPHKIVRQWKDDTIRVYCGNLGSDRAKEADIAIPFDPCFAIGSLAAEEINILRSWEHGTRCIEWVDKTAFINIQLLGIAHYLLYGRLSLTEESTLSDPVPEDCPLVDWIGGWLKQLLVSLFPELRSQVPPLWPNKSPFAACLTHDIDIISWGRVENAKRRLRMALSKGYPARDRIKHVALGFDEILRGLTQRKKIERELDLSTWLSLEDSKGVKACYYFASPLEHDVSDPIYSYEDQVVFREQTITVQEVVRELVSARAEIGLHGSIASSEKSGLIRREKHLLEEVVKKPVAGIRQHYLRARYPETFAEQSSAGFLYDSTVGFNRDIGFRSGTSFPYNLACQSNLFEARGFWELPFVVQDIAVCDYSEHSEEYALSRIRKLLDEVALSGGVFGVVWHNYCARESSFVYRQKVYEILIDELLARGAWIASPKEINHPYWIRKGERAVI